MILLRYKASAAVVNDALALSCIRDTRSELLRSFKVPTSIAGEPVLGSVAQAPR